EPQHNSRPYAARELDGIVRHGRGVAGQRAYIERGGHRRTHLFFSLPRLRRRAGHAASAERADLPPPASLRSRPPPASRGGESISACQRRGSSITNSPSPLNTAQVPPIRACSIPGLE